MFWVFWPRSARPSIPGGSATAPVRNSRNGPTATSTTSASPRATSLSRPKSRSGGPDKGSLGRRRLHRGTPACFFARREPAMMKLRFDDLRQYSDVLRSRHGEAVTVRFVEPRDAGSLQNYFRSLTTRSRYNRFLGAASELPPAVLEDFIHIGEADRFSVVATMLVDGR